MLLLLASVLSAAPTARGPTANKAAAAGARSASPAGVSPEGPTAEEGAAPSADQPSADHPGAAEGAAPNADTAATPWDRLAAAHPDLAAALAGRVVDEGDTAAEDALLDELAEVLLDADPRLVDLLLPADTPDPLADTAGEASALGLASVDLLDAEVWLEGSVLRGVARGVGLGKSGVWVDVDLGGGPAADLQLGFGRGWSRATPLDGGDTPPAGPLPVVTGDRIEFQYDLATSGRGGPDYAGSATALVRSLDGRVEDPGPAGVLGALPDESLDVLVALVDAVEVTDADLAVSLAVTFGALRPLVADEVVATVDADAVERLRYGQGLDAWLAEADAEWRLGTLDALGKLTWAWPATQAAVYGAVPLVGQKAPLDAARWRFVVPSVDALVRLRDTAPVSPGAHTTARAIDDGINGRLRYRAHDELMAGLCRAGIRTPEECEAWATERKANVTLGSLGDTTVHLWDGTSVAWQLDALARDGAYVGDCATATVLAIATMQAVGLPAIGMGWSGQDLNTPTHDVPLWYDGATFRATQRGPSPAWTNSRAFVYVTLPAVHPVNAWTIGKEPGGWARGGSVAGGWTTYGDITLLLRNGLGGYRVGSWIDRQALGGWPSF